MYKSDELVQYLCEHNETHEEGHDGHGQDEQLSAVLLAEESRVHVHHSRDQTLHTHELEQMNKLGFFWLIDLY